MRTIIPIAAVLTCATCASTDGQRQASAPGDEGAPPPGAGFWCTIPADGSGSVCMRTLPSCHGLRQKIADLHPSQCAPVEAAFCFDGDSGEFCGITDADCRAMLDGATSSSGCALRP